MITLTGLDQSPKSGGKAKQLVLLLHGYGADADDLFGLVPYFVDHLPHAHFVSVNAPMRCEMGFGYQWFSLMSRQEEDMVAGLQSAAPLLNAFIDAKLKTLGLSGEDAALIGFSQGTMLSLYTALRRDVPMAGVLGYSGALIAPQLLDEELSSKPEICLVHGEADEVVPFEAFNTALKTLQQHHIPVQGYSREGLGHGIDPAGMQIGVGFLRGAFDAAQAA